MTSSPQIFCCCRLSLLGVSGMEDGRNRNNSFSSPRALWNHCFLQREMGTREFILSELWPVKMRALRKPWKERSLSTIQNTVTLSETYLGFLPTGFTLEGVCSNVFLRRDSQNQILHSSSILLFLGFQFSCRAMNLGSLEEKKLFPVSGSELL